MAMISLREYNHEIESLIDKGSNNEAIFYCTELLKTFPKCIENYRNLGKALLESKKYPEAKEIFSKVLMVIPDDFISHVGLSIISEDGRDLDSAIWHMEQAYDSQPSNLAIQEELRRLFGRRDGIQPTKIRLTHGALVRMYAKGELFQQAISEIRIALTEDPKRIDLKVILAQMFYQSGQTVEAIETCSEIVQILPYCLEAIKILYSGLASSEKKDLAKFYLDKLKELDPYITEDSLESSLLSPELENQILIDKPVYNATASESVVSWSEQFGIELIESKTKTSTDWLTQIETDLSKEHDLVSSENPSPFIEEFTEKHTPTEESTKDRKDGQSSNDDLPDWMRQAGWSESTQPESVAFSEQIDNSTSDETAETGELPDWLRDLTPDNKSDAPDVPSKETKPDEEPISAFDFSLDDSVSENKEENPTEETLPNKVSEPIEPSTEIPKADAEKLEWLNEIESQPQEPVRSEISQDLPDWFSSFNTQAPKQTEPDADADSPSPDWLDSLIDKNETMSAESDIPQPEEPFPDSPVSEEMLGELDRLEQALRSETSELPALSAVDEIQPASSDVMPVEPEVVPSWVKDILNSTPEPTSLNEEVQPSESSPILVENTLDDTKPVIEPLKTQKGNDQEIIESLVTDIPGHTVPDGLISSQTNDELMDWLHGLDPDSEYAEIQESTRISMIPEEEQDQTSLNDSLERLDNITQSAKYEELEEMAKETKTLLKEEVEKESVSLPSIPGSILEQLEDLSELSDESLQSQIETTIDQLIPDNKPELVSEIESISKTETTPVAQISSRPEDLIQILLLEKEVRGDSFEFWLDLGDLYMQVDNFLDALAAYNNAENILLE